MSTQETTQKLIQENSTFFTQRLGYYIQGAHQCLSWIKQSQKGLKREDEGIKNLIKGLQKEADKLWPADSVESLGQEIGYEEGESELDEDLTLKEQPTPADLKEELRQANKRYRVLRKSKVKLKKKNKVLLKILRQIKIAFSGYLKLAKNNSSKTSKSLLTGSEVKYPQKSQEAKNEEKEESFAEALLEPSKKLQNKSIQADQEKISFNRPLEPLFKTFSPIDDSKIIKDLHREYIRSSEKKIQNPKLHLQTVINPSDEKLIGGRGTLLALKNHSSFLIGTSKKGLKVVEKGTLKYKDRLQWNLIDMIYAESPDCYFLLYNESIYRKNIDDEPPSIFLKIGCELQIGKSLQFSNLYEKLVICNNKVSISAINVHTKEIEIDLPKKRGFGISFFKLFGEREDRVISGTSDGYVFLARLDYPTKKDLPISGRSIP